MTEDGEPVVWLADGTGAEVGAAVARLEAEVARLRAQNRSLEAVAGGARARDRAPERASVKIYCALAVWRSVEVPTVQSLLDFQRAALGRRDTTLAVVTAPGDGLVSRARSRLATLFLRSAYDVLLSVDSDIQFRAADALSLCEKAVRHDVVGGMYLTRSDPAQPALPLPPDRPVTFSPTSPLVSVPWLVTGFMAVHRRVFERLAKEMPLCDEDAGGFYPFYAPEVGEIDGRTVYLSEDYAFCQRARQAGFGCWLDPSARIVHHGAAAYALADRPVTLTRRVGGALEVA